MPYIIAVIESSVTCAVLNLPGDMCKAPKHAATGLSARIGNELREGEDHVDGLVGTDVRSAPSRQLPPLQPLMLAESEPSMGAI